MPQITLNKTIAVLVDGYDGVMIFFPQKGRYLHYTDPKKLIDFLSWPVQDLNRFPTTRDMTSALQFSGYKVAGIYEVNRKHFRVINDYVFSQILNEFFIPTKTKGLPWVHARRIDWTGYLPVLNSREIVQEILPAPLDTQQEAERMKKYAYDETQRVYYEKDLRMTL